MVTKQMIGYISRRNLELNSGMELFAFKEATFTRYITSKRDYIRSKLLSSSVDYEDIVQTANMMKENRGVMIVNEPFLLDDELRERAIRWVEWANRANPKELSLVAD